MGKAWNELSPNAQIVVATHCAGRPPKEIKACKENLVEINQALALKLAELAKKMPSNILFSGDRSP